MLEWAYPPLTLYVTGGCCHISVVSQCYVSPLSSVETPELNGNLLANVKSGERIS